MIGPEAKLALRALRDCRVIRASWNCPGYSALRYHRLAVCTPAGVNFDYRLTPRGAAKAKEMFRC